MEVFTNGALLAGCWDWTLPRRQTPLRAQLASTPQVETTFNLVNMGPPADAIIEAFDESGISSGPSRWRECRLAPSAVSRLASSSRSNSL